MKRLGWIRKRIRILSSYGVGLYAANASFYMILSVFPALMLLAALLPVFGVEKDRLLSGMEGLIPQVIYPLMEKILSDPGLQTGGVLLSTTAPIAVWSASRGIHCIRQGLDHMNGTRHTASYLRSRLSSLLYTVLLIFALVGTLILNGFGQSLAVYMTKQPIPIVKWLGMLLRARRLILPVILMGFFGSMYCFLPQNRRSFSSTLPGAALAAVGWPLFTEGYSLYVRFSGSYSLLYGSLSVIAMGMVWLYVCMSILFYGCVLNHRLKG